MTSLRVFSTFRAAEEAWRYFEQDADHYVFQSFDWLSTWYEFIGVHLNIRLCLVLVENSDGSPLMFLPLGIESRWGIRRLVWLGAINADYRAPLLSRTHGRELTPTVFGSIWAELKKALPNFDAIHLEFQPEFIQNQDNPFTNLQVRPHLFSAHYAQLSESWDVFYTERLGAKSRATERRKERRLRNHGDLSLIDVGTHEEVERLIDEMIIQKSLYYVQVGASNIFHKNGYREFYREMVLRFSSQGLIQLSALKLNGEPLAVHWGARQGGRFYYLMPSYTDGPYKKYSPGNILLNWLIERSIEAGDRVFDFTVGDESYKARWSNENMKLFRFLEATNRKGQLYVYGIKSYLWLRVAIKKSRVLFSMFKHARVLASSYHKR